MSLTNSHTFDYLILDSNAFIRGHGFDLYNKAKHIVTVPEVLSEIKDSKARELLEKLPFTLDIRNPSPAACQAGI
jgi:rRNA maturation endonuclease Nob1